MPSLNEISGRRSIPETTNDVVSMGVDVMVALIVGCLIILLLLIVASIYVYHVRKEKQQTRRIEKEIEREKRRRFGLTSVGTNSAMTLDRADHGLKPQVTKVDAVELEGSRLNELDGKQIQELWDAGCAKEMLADELLSAIVELEAVAVKKLG
jgi:hypothetical protein